MSPKRVRTHRICHDMRGGGPELKIGTDLTVNGTFQEHHAALRIGSGVARSGRNPLWFSDTFARAPQT